MLKTRIRRYAFFLGFLLCAAAIPHQTFALDAPDFYHLNGTCFSTDGTHCDAGDNFDYQGEGSYDEAHLPRIETAELLCSSKYDECSLQTFSDAPYGFGPYGDSDCDFENGCSVYFRIPNSSGFTGDIITDPPANGAGAHGYKYCSTSQNGGQDCEQWYSLVRVRDALTANPTSIQSGQSAKLSWSAQYANDGCRIDQGVGTTSPQHSLIWGEDSGQKDVLPTETTTYTLTCIGDSRDNTGDIATVEATATVTVSQSQKLPDYDEGGLAPTPIDSPTFEPGTSVDFSAAVYNDPAKGTGDSSVTSNLRIQVDPKDDGGAGHYGSETKNLDTSGYPVDAIKLGDWSNSITSLSFAIPKDAEVGTWYKFRACADTPGNRVEEVDENNNCGPDGDFQVAAIPEPSLTATYDGPTEAEDQQSTELDGTVLNGGTASTGDSFPNEFEINPDKVPKNFTDIQALRYVKAGPLDVNKHQDVSVNYTFNNEFDGWSGNSRTWYVRLCSDTNADDDHPIDVSDPDDLCSTWTPVTVTSSGNDCGMASAQISAKPTRVSQGDTTHISWTASGVSDQNTCTISGPNMQTQKEHGDKNCNVSDNGGQDPEIDDQSTYTISCDTLPPADDSVTVDVVPGIQEF